MRSMLRALGSMLVLGLLGLVLWAMPAGAAPSAYVANGVSNTVSVIATATSTVVATIPVGVQPSEVAITPDGAFAYVTNYNSSTVSVIATATNTVVATIPVGVGPLGVAITPDGAFAYVTNLNSNTVSVIATATNTVVATIPMGVGPSRVAITPDGAFAYVVNGLTANTVSVIATATNTVVATIPVGIGPLGVAITPDGAFAYVTNGLNGVSNTVSVIATATNTVVATIPVGIGPLGVAITPDGAFAYVVNFDFGSSTVSVIATATNTVVATIPMVAQSSEVAITPDGAFAYVTNTISANTVSVIATATNTVVATIPVGVGPSGVAITPATLLTALSPAQIWVGLKNSDDVGLRLDLLAEVFVGAAKVGQGQLNNVAGGSSGFNNAILRTLALSLTGGAVPVSSSTQLKLKVSVRRTCFGAGHASGTARLWFNGQPIDSGASRTAGSRFDATIGTSTSNYFLRSGLVLSTTAGTSNQFVDAFVNSAVACPSRPFTGFGIWSIPTSPLQAADVIGFDTTITLADAAAKRTGNPLAIVARTYEPGRIWSESYTGDIGTLMEFGSSIYCGGYPSQLRPDGWTFCNWPQLAADKNVFIFFGGFIPDVGETVTLHLFSYQRGLFSITVTMTAPMINSNTALFVGEDGLLYLDQELTTPL